MYNVYSIKYVYAYSMKMKIYLQVNILCKIKADFTCLYNWY